MWGFSRCRSFDSKLDTDIALLDNTALFGLIWQMTFKDTID